MKWGGGGGEMKNEIKSIVGQIIEGMFFSARANEYRAETRSARGWGREKGL